MRRSMMPVWLLASAMVAGCQSLKSEPTRSRTQEHWRQMRAGVKLQLAGQQFDAGQFEAAAKTAAEAVALDPQKANAYVLIARSQVERNRVAEAMQTVETAKRAGARSAELDYTRGVLHELSGEYDAALHAFDDARRVDPNRIDYLVASVECLAAMDRGSEAQALLDQRPGELRDDGTLAALQLHVDSLNASATDSTATVTARGVALEGSRILQEETGRQMAREGRCYEALSVLEPVLREGDADEVPGSVRRAAAACYLAQNNPTQAHNVLAAYSASHPDDALAQLLLAKAALATGDFTAALRAIDLVQQREPNRPDLWLVRATSHWMRGNHADATNDLLDLLRNDPADVEARCLLGEVYRAQERREAARAQFERVLTVDPQCSWALAALRKLESDPIREAGERPEAKLTAAPGQNAESPVQP